MLNLDVIGRTAQLGRRRSSLFVLSLTLSLSLFLRLEYYTVRVARALYLRLRRGNVTSLSFPFSLHFLPPSFSRCRFKTECSVSPVNFREGRHRIWNISYEMHFYRRFFLREHHTDNLVGEPVVIENVEIFGEISIQNLEMYSIRGILSDSRRLVSSIFEFFLDI